MKYRQKEYCKVLDGNHKNFRELQMQNNYFVQSLFRVVYNKIPGHTPTKDTFNDSLIQKNAIKMYIENSMISKLELLANYKRSSTLCYNYSSIACTVKQRDKMIQEAAKKKNGKDKKKDKF